MVMVTSTGTAACNATIGCCTDTVSPLSLLSYQYAGSSFQQVWVVTFDHPSSRSSRFDLSLRKTNHHFLTLPALVILYFLLTVMLSASVPKGKALDYTGYSEGGSRL